MNNGAVLPGEFPIGSKQAFFSFAPHPYGMVWRGFAHHAGRFRIPLPPLVAPATKPGAVPGVRLNLFLKTTPAFFVQQPREVPSLSFERGTPHHEIKEGCRPKIKEG